MDDKGVDSDGHGKVAMMKSEIDERALLLIGRGLMLALPPPDRIPL